MPKDDVSGLPDVDLGPVKADLENQGSAPQSQTQEPELDLDQFKNPKDMLKSYKEIQAAFTKTSQENKLLKEKIQEIETMMEESAYTAPAPTVNPQHVAGTGTNGNDFESTWMQNPQQAVDERALAMFKLAQINSVIQQEQRKDPRNFMERAAFVDRLSQDPRYAHLRNDPDGVSKLFQAADKLRTEMFQSNTRKSLEWLAGREISDEELPQLRQKLFGNPPTNQQPTNNDAYMPDTTASSSRGQPADRSQQSQSKIAEAVKKGDVDGVLETMFRDIAAE